MRSVTINYFPNSVIFILAVNLLCERKVHSVKISLLKVPEAVQNGSESGAILDCNYRLSNLELSTNSGLVVKWFFDRNPNPVYQWIHHQKPQDAGILKGRLKLDYKATDQNSSMYRALYIARPTIELTGEYKCLVSTLHDEDFSMKKMTVFVPEKKIEFNHYRYGSDKINISCRVEGVFPKPELRIYKDPDRSADKTYYTEVIQVSWDSRHGGYDMVLSAIFDESCLETPSVFDCELRIENFYVKRKTLLYYPGAMESLSSKVSGSAVYVPLQVIYVLLISMCCLSTYFSRWS